jgi:DNA-directed RNA polymerase subunit RPC12/RpoP
MDRTYRCLTCLEHTLSRGFDTSHLSVTCPVCGSFERFVNEAVFEQFRAFEDSPPESLEWSTLERGERLMISEAVARRGRSIEDFSIER